MSWSADSIVSQWESPEDFERAKLDMRVFGVGYAAFFQGPNGFTLHHVSAEAVRFHVASAPVIRDYAESG